MRKTKIISITAAAFFMLSVNCFAEQDPEAAARQAKIDADQAGVEINQAQNEIDKASNIDGVDATTIIANQEKINNERRRQIDALKRESEANNNR